MKVSATIDITKQTLCLKWADMTNPNIIFQEQFSSKKPTLTLLSTLGCQFSPKQLLTDKNGVVVDG